MGLSLIYITFLASGGLERSASTLTATTAPSFLPEFPLLHLRKSKIVNFISAYRAAGVLNLIRFMKDTNETDLNKLVRPEQIEVATKFIGRLATALQVVINLLIN